MMNKTKIKSFFSNAGKLKVLVIGDVMLDSYIWGSVNRISPEAPVPIVTVNKRTNLLGGAANVALNIKAIGAEPILCSVIGNDSKGRDLLELLKIEGLTQGGIYSSEERITTTKFRVIGNNSQLLRVDEESDNELSMFESDKLINKFNFFLSHTQVDVIIIQDYNKGVLSPRIIERVINQAKKHQIPVAVDPKKKNFELYRDIALFKPNLSELTEGLKIEFNPTNQEELANAAGHFQEKQQIKNLIVTLSERGIFISSINENNQYERHLIPSHVRSVADVSGAGDTVISVASLCLALQLPSYEMAFLSNLAGGLVCESVGVAPIDRNKFYKEIQNYSAND
ncbi:MAG: hypothetical protein KAT48_11415 [Bacteroidales bacterium]|nr:hypothetical protein [Bacteroidales bacterium]